MTALAARVLAALDASGTDFRTTASLASQLGAEVVDVQAALAELGEQVRNPDGGDPEYRDWWRLTARGLTPEELWRRARAMAGHIEEVS